MSELYIINNFILKNQAKGESIIIENLEEQIQKVKQFFISIPILDEFLKGNYDIKLTTEKQVFQKYHDYSVTQIIEEKNKELVILNLNLNKVIILIFKDIDRQFNKLL